MPNDYLTLTREQLYELVWSKPVSELAKDFGISDVAVAKRLRKLRVPVPGRGYWARVYAGQEPIKVALPEKEVESRDQSALTFGAPSELEPPTVEETQQTDALQESIAKLSIVRATEYTAMHPVVLRTAFELKRPWRRDIRWKRSERDGPIVRISVSESAQDRALVFADMLIRAAAQLGWDFVILPADPEETRRSRYSMPATPPNPRPSGIFDVMGEKINVFVEERSRRIEHVLTDEEKRKQKRGEYYYAPAWDYQYRGELRVKLVSVENDYLDHAFADAKKAKIEDLLPAMLQKCGIIARELKRRREEERLRKIEERRQEILRLERAERRDAHRKLAHELERQAGAWAHARFLRRYVRAAKRALGDEKALGKFLGESIDFIAWAEGYVEQLDPLAATPRNPDLQERDSYYSTEERLEAAAGRLIGADWKSSAKLLREEVAEEDDVE